MSEFSLVKTDTNWLFKVLALSLGVRSSLLFTQRVYSHREYTSCFFRSNYIINWHAVTSVPLCHKLCHTTVGLKLHCSKVTTDLEFLVTISLVGMVG